MSIIKDWHSADSRQTWRVATSRTFHVEVVGWPRGDGCWTWNVYANVYESHPMFATPLAVIESAPWHCGCTYDEIITATPAQGIRYDWQKEAKVLKCGSDYSHAYDEGYMNWPAREGIPPRVIRDAEELVAWLEGGAA